jgi:serine/threonine-protein kinase
MEYLEGRTLEDLIKTHGPLPASRVLHLLRQLCGALAEAHAAGLVHRDLKPGNVIVATLGGQQDMAKLLDFGLVYDSSADTDQRLTQMGMLLGTPAYMCPEQAAGESAVDARGDIYSLVALTGRPPFQAKTAVQLLAAHRLASLRSVFSLRFSRSVVEGMSTWRRPRTGLPAKRRFRFTYPQHFAERCRDDRPSVSSVLPAGSRSLAGIDSH